MLPRKLKLSQGRGEFKIVCRHADMAYVCVIISIRPVPYTLNICFCVQNSRHFSSHVCSMRTHAVHKHATYSRHKEVTCAVHETCD